MDADLFDSIDIVLKTQADGIEFIISGVTHELGTQGADDLSLVITIAGDVIHPDELFFNDDETERLYVLTLAAIYKMLKEEKIVAGSMNEDWSIFTPWHLSPEQCVEQTALMWKKLGRMPNPTDESVWFKNR